MGLEDNYKRAVIKLAENLPKILNAINSHTLALIDYTEELRRPPPH